MSRRPPWPGLFREAGAFNVLAGEIDVCQTRSPYSTGPSTHHQLKNMMVFAHGEGESSEEQEVEGNRLRVVCK